MYKLKNESSGPSSGNFEKVEGTRKPPSSYAERDWYVEYKDFQEGTYYFFTDISWNGKANSKSYVVNCYGPCCAEFLEDVGPQVS